MENSKINITSRIINSKLVRNNNINSSVKKNNKYTKKINFSEILNNEILSRNSRLSFSKHATERLTKRGIILDSTDISNLNSAIESAEKKGSKQTLVIMRDTSYIVNIPNKTIITAINNTGENNHIFTNIDSAVVF